jgi:hypothetical protein
MTYFAYIHAKPDTVDASGIFYVGKGKGGRSHDLSPRNRHHGFVGNKYGKSNILVGKFEVSSEQIAFDLEIGIIKCLRRMGVELTNQTDGGDGISGFKASPEQRARHSEASKEVGARSEVIAARSKATTELNLARWADPEYKARTSAAMTGKPKTMSAEAIEARRINAQANCRDDVKAKTSAASKQMWSDPEFKAKMSQAKSAAWQDPAKREAMLANRSKGISESWKDPEVRANRINGIKNAMKGKS